MDNSDKILNPTTGRYVKKSSVLGKQLLAGITPTKKSKACSDTQIRNPNTNRCIKKNGKLAKSLNSSSSTSPITISNIPNRTYIPPPPPPPLQTKLAPPKLVPILEQELKRKIKKRADKKIKDLLNETADVFNNQNTFFGLDALAAAKVEEIKNKSNQSNAIKKIQASIRRKIDAKLPPPPPPPPPPPAPATKYTSSSSLSDELRKKLLNRNTKKLLDNQQKIAPPVQSIPVSNIPDVIDMYKKKYTLNPPRDIMGMYKDRLPKPLPLNEPRDIISMYKKKVDKIKVKRRSKPYTNVINVYKNRLRKDQKKVLEETRKLLKSNKDRIDKKTSLPTDVIGMYKKKYTLNPPRDVIGIYKNKVEKNKRTKPYMDVMDVYKNKLEQASNVKKEPVNVLQFYKDKLK
jgi:hypothetical protein